MDTPIYDFVKDYAARRGVRLHMPGHKGRPFLGCEEWDITEVAGADALYEAEGIIARSEQNAAALFGSGATFYSTEGSSHCIKAMLHLALQCRRREAAPVIVAARNVHRSFVHAAALLGFTPLWLQPEGGSGSVCSCPVTPEGLELALEEMTVAPAAVYLTSPDYLGGMADITALAEVCHRHGTLLLVDNAHGAYLHFLPRPIHPLDLGADLTCDSAHKTLPVLTGGAYLHIGKNAPGEMAKRAKSALALFGSTSPSYLTLASLDLCNACLAGDYAPRLSKTAAELDGVRARLRWAGWTVEQSDPLRLTLTAPAGRTGTELSQILRDVGVECEYADEKHLVAMVTPENTPEELWRLPALLGENRAPARETELLPPLRAERVLSVREALFAPAERVAREESLGRVCAGPTVACPPAIPIVVAGERIDRSALELLARYGVEWVDVVIE